METWQTAAGALVIALAIAAVLIWSTKTEVPQDGCHCEKIRNDIGVDLELRVLYWELIRGVRRENEEAMRYLFQLANPLDNRACHVARGDESLKIAFCSVWPGVEAMAHERGWSS